MRDQRVLVHIAPSVQSFMWWASADSTRFSSSPALKAPPPVNAEGKVVQPAQEKSFLQKYWVYIAVALAALGMSPSPASFILFGEAEQSCGDVAFL